MSEKISLDSSESDTKIKHLEVSFLFHTSNQ